MMHSLILADQRTNSLTDETNSTPEKRTPKKESESNPRNDNIINFYNSNLFKKLSETISNTSDDDIKTPLDEYKRKLDEIRMGKRRLIEFDQKIESDSSKKLIKNNMITDNQINQIKENNIESKCIEYNKKAQKDFLKIGEFKLKYKSFIEDSHKYGNIEILADIEKYWLVVFKVFSIVNDFGKDQGSYEVNAYRFWEKFQQDFFDSQEKLYLNSYGGLKSFYSKYLFQFERYQYFKNHCDPAMKKRIYSVFKMDYTNLVDPNVISQCEYQKSINYTDVLQKQTILFENGVQVFDLDPKPFQISRIEKLYGDQKIDIVIQNREFNGITKDESKKTQYKKTMKIREYVGYQRTFLYEDMPKKYHDPNKNLIKFAVNIDVDEWGEVLEELSKKIPEQLLFCSKYDMLRYLNQGIKGITVPQLYLKVPGCWTGGHEENLRVRAININHGPMDCEWYTVGAEFVPDLRKLLIEEHKIDIHKEEGLWILDIDFLIEHNIPVNYFIQRPNEIVLLGPGCFHWVRSKGVTLNSAWNFCSKDFYQFSKAFERYDINKTIKFNSIIPLHNLVLNILNKEEIDDELKDFFKKRLRMYYEDELIAFKSLSVEEKKKFEKEEKGAMAIMCNLCSHETLFQYFYCSKCKTDEKKIVLCCLNCHKNHKLDCKNPDQIKFFYKKEIDNILTLLEISDSLFYQYLDVKKSKKLLINKRSLKNHESNDYDSSTENKDHNNLQTQASMCKDNINIEYNIDEYALKQNSKPLPVNSDNQGIKKNKKLKIKDQEIKNEPKKREKFKRVHPINSIKSNTINEEKIEIKKIETVKNSEKNCYMDEAETDCLDMYHIKKKIKLESQPTVPIIQIQTTNIEHYELNKNSLLIMNQKNIEIEDQQHSCKT